MNDFISGTNDLLFRGALALALGFIVGFQRERSGHNAIAGIRTFPLFTLTGFFCALLAQSFGGWTIAAGLIAMTGILLIGAFENRSLKSEHIGVTTEAAALVVFLTGAYLAIGDRLDFAVAAGGITALLLYLKDPIHGAIEKMQTLEIRAVMNFVLIAFVVLPLLPDASYDSFGVLNPREIWMVVVLIAGISLASYAIQRATSEKTGAFWIGTLGGLVSSTATTFTYARRSKTDSSSVFVTIALLVASTIAFLRILIEVAVVAPNAMSTFAPPLGAMAGIMILLCLVAYRRGQNEHQKRELTAEDPFQLKVAIVFGLLYAVILYASAWLEKAFGSSGLYVLAVVSGLIDVDAITISTAQLVNKNALAESNGWRVVLVAALSNLGFKGAIVATFARGPVRWKVPWYFAVAIAAGLMLVALWPD